MEHERIKELLGEYVAEDLGAAEAREVAAHLTECESCRAEADALERLLGTARDLPAEISPRRDLWPDIAQRLDQSATNESQRADQAWTHFGTWFRSLALRPWPAAFAGAAVVLLVVLIGGRTLLSSPDQAVYEVAEADPTAAALITALEAECRASELEFERLSVESEGETATFIDAIRIEIRTIDTAIGEARDAWNADPQSPHLARLLASYYRAKAALQGRATQVASRV